MAENGGDIIRVGLPLFPGSGIDIVPLLPPASDPENNPRAIIALASKLAGLRLTSGGVLAAFKAVSVLERSGSSWQGANE